MLLVTGLGNPGGKYASNRHNIGFMAVDAIADAHGFGPWKSKFQAQVSEGRLGREKILLMKPQTFMNNSGQAVGEAMRFYKLGPEDVLVFYDELDLAPGKCRIKKGGGTAGHNGIRSLHAHISDAYTRIRLGIGHPGEKRLVSNHVLGNFSKADQEWLSELLRGIADGAPELANGDASKFMNAVALRTAPPRSSNNAPDAKPKPEVKEKKPTAEPDTRNPLQRLRDKFSN